MWATDGTGGYYFFSFFFAGPLSLPLSESRAGERDVFSLAVVWPNGPSKLCTNQLAQLTLEMVCQPVNLEQKGTAGGEGQRTGGCWEATLASAWQLKGGRWEDRGSNGKMLLMAALGRVEGSIKKTTCDTDPRRQRKSNNSYCISM